LIIYIFEQNTFSMIRGFILHNFLNSLWFILVAFSLLSCEKEKPETDEFSKSLFTRVPSNHSGITFKNIVEEKFENYFAYYPYIYNGGGVAVGDINNDGLTDIYFTANEHANKLYLNKGALKFEDISQSAGVEGKKGWDNGVSMVDINHDGYLDIYICRGGWQDTDEERRNLLYVNNGDLTFTEKASEFGLDDVAFSTHATFFDMDNDNDLDAYIINRPDSFYLPLSTMRDNRYIPNDLFRDKLYRNEEGKFNEIGLEAGITENFGYSLGVMTADFNHDGFKDIFVANDYSERDFLFINDGDGTFTDKTKEAMHHLSLSSMGVDMADINNDGLEDLVVLEMQPEDYTRAKVSMPPMDLEGYNAIQEAGMHKQYLRNVLFLNMGNNFYSEIGNLAGMTNTDWSWGCLTSDYDNDGFRDLFITNGFRRDVMNGDIQMKTMDFIRMNRHRFKDATDMFNNAFDEFINLYDGIKLKNYLFKNNGNLTFTDVSGEWGFYEYSFSNGSAVADFDKDGDLDIVINNLADEAWLFENTQKDNNYIQIELTGPDLNPFGLGTYISIYYDGKIQFFENKTVRGYLSSSTTIPHFGLGKTESIDSIKVRWTDGKENILTNIPTNQILKIAYNESAIGKEPVVKLSSEKPLFQESTKPSLKPAFVHHENEFFEYNDQKLLPHGFAKSGPFISVGDINGDGLDDFYIGGAKGQAGSLYRQQNDQFIKVSSSTLQKDKDYEDMGSEFFDVDGDNDMDLYVVSGGSEYHEGNSMYQDRLYLNDGNGQFTKTDLPKTISSGSCVEAFDFDQDGDMDLFVGGQVIAGAYPTPPKSYVFVNDRGKLIDKTDEIAPGISRIGMVKSAVFTDLNQNNQPELVIVGEWMPIKILEYSENKFLDKTSDYSLDKTNGWWNKVVSNDLDNDGDQDLIIGNLGENYKYKTSIEKPFQVFARDFDRSGTNDILLAYYHGNNLKPVRGKEILTKQLPVIEKVFPTYMEFAKADMKDILGQGMENSFHLLAYEFSSIILINNDGQFEMKKLPVQAQFSTLNGILIDDYNKDGVKDLIIGGNKFDVEIETSPADASPGFVLLGKGDFKYEAQLPSESGFFIPYNVKDLRSINSKNETFILVSSNNDSLRVFKPNK